MSKQSSVSKVIVVGLIAVIAMMCCVLSACGGKSGGSSGSSGSSSSTSSTSNSQSSNLKAVAEPSSGSILDGSEYGDALITIKAANDASAYVKVVDGNSTVVGFYVQAGDSASVAIPTGTYRVHFAQGETWYGKSNRFGKSTSYGQDDDPLRVDAGQEIIYELQHVSNGNFSMDSLKSSEF